MLQVNIAADPAVDEQWFSLDDLSLDDLEALNRESDMSWTLWDTIWKHNARFARAAYAAALKGSGAVELGIDEAVRARLKLSLVRRGRIFRVVDDEADLPQEWEGAVPSPLPEGSGLSMTS